MARRLILLVIATAAAAACERRRPPDPRPIVQQALSGIPVYPRSSDVEISAGEEAGQLTLSSVDSVSRVAEWFRRALALNGWSLQSDITNRDGSISISAMRGKRPLWLTLRPNVGGPGTTYTLIGAVVAGDSVAVAESAGATNKE
jgi:hypothetical protein